MLKLRRLATGIASDRSGVALIEFAYVLPVFMILALGGVELTHYITTKMRVSQLALHVADHAARIGSGTLLSVKTISEKQINDLFTGSGYQAGGLDLYGKGRVILSSLEPVARPNTTDRYKIAWQRCRGSATHASGFGVTGDTNLTGIGPAGRKVKAPEDGAVMFVEVFYRYTPIIASRYAPTFEFTEIASMIVREQRDLTGGVYNNENAPVSSCN